MVVVVVQGIALLLQCIAAILALRLIRITGRYAAWVLIAAGITLIVARRIVSFARLLATDAALQPGFGGELLESLLLLAISLLLVAGIALIGPLFRSIRRSEDVLRGAHAELEERVRERTAALARANEALRAEVVERRQAEETLRASEHKYRTLLENLPQRIFLKDRNSVYISCNSNYAHDLGIEPDEIKGKTDHDFYPKELADKYRADDQEVIASGATRNIEERYIQDGRELIVHTVKTPIRDHEGRPAGVLGIFWDITREKQAQEEIRKLNEDLKRRTIELEAANRELEAFSYSVSHDLRAPLRLIDGFSQALLEDYEEKLDEEGKDYLHRVRRSTQQMAGLIDDLLRLSRIGRAEMRVDEVDLSVLAREVAQGLQQTDPSRQVEWAIHPGLSARGDLPLLRIVLENLLGNAWKFTSKRTPARIEFGATTQDGETVYFVRDNGAGFDMAYADKLFAPFQRLHTAEEFPGTGIGLALVQRVIHRHGGRVWAEGAVDRGATFYFTLAPGRRAS